MRITAARMQSGSYRRSLPAERIVDDPAPEQYTVDRSDDGQRFRVRRFKSSEARRHEAEVIVTRVDGETDTDCLARAQRELDQVTA